MIRLLLFTILLWPCFPALRAADSVFNAAAEFDRANKFYEQGKYSEAAAAYENLANSGAPSVSVFFNLGNAAYKAGEIGRAIAAYRMAERLNPRDASLRANLQFVRGKVYSDERSRLSLWMGLVRFATLNEWTVLSAALLWASFSVLACGELTHRRYAKTTAFLFIMFALSAVATYAAVRDRTGRQAVVVAREATARFGPLDESQSAFQLRDGAEVIVLASKDRWLQVLDAEKRTGWIRDDAVIVLPAALRSRDQSARL